MSPDQIILLFAAFTLVVLAIYVIARRGGSDEQNRSLSETAEKLVTAQAELAGRISQLTENQAAAQKLLDERLADVTRRVGESLEKSSQKAQTSMTEMKERLAVINAAQKNITELSGQVEGLQNILANKQTRGAFGEIRLNDLVKDALPPSAYDLQVTLSNGKRVDCLIQLPNPPGSISIDAKFPLESYRALREAGDDAARKIAARSFGTDIKNHLRDIAEKYILPGETAETALMFLPSEAVYGEIHANFPEIVEMSFRARVLIVSPSTLWATLNTVRAVLKCANRPEPSRKRCIFCWKISSASTRGWVVFGSISTWRKRISARSTPPPARSPAAVKSFFPKTFPSPRSLPKTARRPCCRPDQTTNLQA